MARAALWLGATAGTAAAMLPVRARLDKAHVTLVFLLVVLGASASGGRALGLGVAGAAFLLFDWFFLPPFGALSVTDPLDWLVLVAFLVTSVVAAQLLDRARREAEAARARAAEVDRLAALGARALTAGRAEAALAGVADAVRSTLGLDGCTAWPEAALAPDAGVALPTTVVLAAESRAVVAERQDGTVHVARALLPVSDASAAVAFNAATGSVRAALGGLDPAELRALVVPLAVGEAAGARVVAVLRLERADGLVLPEAGWRYLDALAYYAALAADRVRLAGADERAAVLAEAGRLKDALMAAVSHDLRTPLTTIKALAHTLGATAPDADAAERAATIQQEADRLARLVGDLLDFSRLAGGAMPLAVEINAADDLLDVVQQRVTGALAGRALDVTLPPGAPLMLGRFDLAASARVVVNLVENAHKYAPPGTRVELAVDEARDADGRAWLRIAVRDRGPGVPAAERERIFEPFYRAPGARADVHGAGLGLAIARQLAEAQGGALAYAAREGGGSVFTLSVPAAEGVFTES
ncbi:hypothetical protein tb265_22630 [Gemmatimonadetes bacterium T265]|nr:hypothetical protein tb265_22630 [Gemmatimonadetes bacterium T265]